jgi:phage-related tail protein
MKRPAVLTESIPYIFKMAIGNAGMEYRKFKKGTAFLPSTFSEKVKNQRELKTTKKLRTPEIP